MHERVMLRKLLDLAKKALLVTPSLGPDQWWLHTVFQYDRHYT